VYFLLFNLAGFAIAGWALDRITWMKGTYAGRLHYASSGSVVVLFPRIPRSDDEKRSASCQVRRQPRGQITAGSTEHVLDQYELVVRKLDEGIHARETTRADHANSARLV
jgi:hypothetical protein